MHTGLVTALGIVTVVGVAANVFISIADFRRAKFVLENSAKVGVPSWAIPYLGALKMAGALGLAVGFSGVPWLGVAAGTGLVLFFVGAIGVHVRARVFYNIGGPSLYLLLAICGTAYFAHALR